MNFRSFKLPYPVDERYSKKVAYFSMEFAIHQPLKIYSGGLGFLSGSHLRSAYELRQNLIGIGILWKEGYYDQVVLPLKDADGKVFAAMNVVIDLTFAKIKGVERSSIFGNNVL